MIKRGPRFDVAYDCALIDGKGDEQSVRVTDISREGCRIESEKPLGIGERVVIRLASHGDHSAKIRWSLGHEAGAAFAAPLAIEA